MNISYDPQADALYINLREATIDDTIEAGRYVFVDIDADGIPVGVELLFAGRIWKAPGTPGITVNIALPELTAQTDVAA
jgi:uncharacterized protein YuzE